MDALEARKLKYGDRIRISEDVSTSIELFGAVDGFKEKLRNTFQEVEKVEMSDHGLRIIIQAPRTASFCPGDISRVTSKQPKIKIETFDPEQLVL
jgi:hypothetical protein